MFRAHLASRLSSRAHLPVPPSTQVNTGEIRKPGVRILSILNTLSSQHIYAAYYQPLATPLGVF